MTGPHDRETTIAALMQAVPYIRLYRNRTFVIKLGGAACADPKALRNIVEQARVLREMGIRVVLVHGGGPQATTLAGRLGVETVVVDGRRVTDDRTLEVAIMAINGAVRTAVLSACLALEMPAVGVSGVDAGMIRAVRRPPVTGDAGGVATTVDYGLVGDIVSVDPSLVERLLEAGTVPVVSPLSADAAGRVLNVNADTVARAVAVALGAAKLIVLTDSPGLLGDPADPASLVSYVDLAGLDALEARGAAGGGMLPKIKAAREAVAGGVPRVHIVGYRARAGLLLEVFTNEGCGTLIVRDRAELMPSEEAAPASAGGKAGS